MICCAKSGKLTPSRREGVSDLLMSDVITRAQRLRRRGDAGGRLAGALGADEARVLRGEGGPRTRGHGQATSRLNRNQVTLPAAVQVSSQPNQISLLNYLPNP